MIVLSSEWACPPNVTDSRTFHSKPSWSKANNNHIDDYKNVLRDNLNSIELPTSVLLCEDVMCYNAEHARLLNEYTNSIIHSRLQAGDNSIPCTSNKTASKSVPGWMEFVHEARSKSGIIFG